jgi:hypothetical protein
MILNSLEGVKYYFKFSTIIFDVVTRLCLCYTGAIMSTIMVALILALAQVPSAGQKNKEAVNTQGTKKAESSKPAPPSPSVTVNESVDCPPSESHCEGQTTESPKKSHDALDWINGIATCVIAAFTIFAAIAVGWQVKTSRQIERAWISVEIKHDIKTDDLIWRVLKVRSLTFDCKFVNRGRTPAKLVSCQICSEVRPIESLTPQPNFGADMKVLNGIVVTPNDHESENVTINNELIEKFNNKRGEIFIYGVVNYLDAFGVKHYSRFRFHYPYLGKIEPSDEIPISKDGPTSYHEAT